MIETVQQLWQAFWAIPHIRLYLPLAWVAYLLWLGVYIVLQKREPAATLAWLISLAALPYVGIGIYYLIGPQKIERQRLRRTRHHVTLTTTTPDAGDDADVRELERLGRAVTGLPQTTARQVELLIDGAAKFDRLLQDVAQAQTHIHLEYYIFAPDHSGTVLRDALAERAREGVCVRLLLDAVGSSKAHRRFLQPLQQAGAQIAWFHPLRLGRLWQRPWLNLRTHRKIVIIDHRIGYTGGMNVTDDQDARIKADAYHDLHLRLEGDAVRWLQLVFCEDWAYASGSNAFMAELGRQLPAAQHGAIITQVLTSGPDNQWEPIHRLHVSAIHAAKRRVWLATPYFVPGEAAMMAITSAAQGGLDVRLLVPKMSDSRLVTYAGRSYYDTLLQAGVRVHEFGPPMVHAKALLVDDDLALIGSANFDHRSFRLNFEVAMLFHDAGVAADLERMLQADFARAPRVRDDRHRSLLAHRLPEALARLMSPLL